MRRTAISVAAAGACAAQAPARAQASAYDQFRPSAEQIGRQLNPEFGSCMEASGGVTAAMRDCWLRELVRRTLWLERYR